MRTGRLVAILLAAIWGLGSLSTAVVSAQTAAVPTGLEQAWSLTTARDAVGDLWAAWEVDDGHDAEVVVGRWLGDEWSVPSPLAGRPQAWDRAPSLALAANGTLWLAWSSTERTSPETSRIHVARWLGQSWSKPEVVPVGSVFGDCATCGRATEPVLAASRDGTMWLAWIGAGDGQDNVFAQRWNGGVWSLPRQVSADDQPAARYDRHPRLAVGRDGRPWAVWTGSQGGLDDEIYFSRWTGSGWAAEALLNAGDEALDTWPSLALDAQGVPWVAWQARVADGELSHLRILVAHWDGTHTTWTAETIASSPLGSEIDEMHPDLSADEQGTVHLAWVALGNGQSALGYAGRRGATWSEPRLVRSGVSAEGEALLVPGAEGSALLWLDPLAAGRLPVERIPVSDEPLSRWADRQVPSRAVTADPFPNRYLAFGDSITWGGYPPENPHYPYPSILQDTLKLRVSDLAHTINVGDPGEGTREGANRIKLEVSEYRPKYVLIMQGTNDVSREITPAEVYDHLLLMIANATKHAGVDGVKAMLATIIPRLDERNEATRQMNEQAIIPAANAKAVPLADQWQAFYNYGNWQSLYFDEKHPNQVGLELIAGTFYDRILAAWPDLVQEEAVAPTTWVEALPAQSQCGSVSVAWNGSDNLNWVVDYDVQVQANQGTWTDWLLATQATNGIYPGGAFGDQLSFRVRGRDLVGNESAYSSPQSTTVSDNVAPEAHVGSLAPIQALPFVVSWSGTDNCAGVVAYRVEYRVGAQGTWTGWLASTPATSGSFNPSSPAYGGTYYFRVAAQDAAGIWGTPSTEEVSTTLVRYILAGKVYNVRHQPVAGANIGITPSPLRLVSLAGSGFVAYLQDGGSYQVSAARTDLFDPLPPMQGLNVTANVSDLTFILPPHDNAVSNGGFESGGLSGWTPGGSLPPAADGQAHTGLGAARLGGTGESSSLVQVITPAAGLTEPSLSFLVRLADGASPASTLQVSLSGGTTAAYTLPVASTTWSHAWQPLALTLTAGQPVTLTLAASNVPAILVDEVSLGSAVAGGHWIYLPVSVRP